MREYDDDALLEQLRAFWGYRGRGGRQTLEDWMDGKGFTRADCEFLRRAAFAQTA